MELGWAELGYDTSGKVSSSRVGWGWVRLGYDWLVCVGLG